MINLEIKTTHVVRLSAQFVLVTTNEDGYKAINTAHKDAAKERYELTFANVVGLSLKQVKVLCIANTLNMAAWNKVKMPDRPTYGNQQPTRRFKYSNRVGKNYIKPYPLVPDVQGDYGNSYIPGGDFHRDTDQYRDLLQQLENPEYIFIYELN